MNEQGNSNGTQWPESLSTKLNRLTEKAKSNPTLRFNNLAHLLGEPMLEKAFRELRKDAAAGVDGMTYADYEQDLKGNLERLVERMKQNQYRAQPLRRVYIDKEDGKKRALSIPSIEDKIVQRSVVDILSRLYESKFLPCSYGYRPGKSPHSALDEVWNSIMGGRINYILEVDIQDYFGSIVRDKLMDILKKRIGDPRLLRLIGKWLHVGALEDGRLLTTKTGVGQGTIISPILSNLYLHEVLDQWVEQDVKPRMKGETKLCRFSDDFILLFEHREDAEKVWRVLPKRFEKYGLTLHPEKTKLIEFGRKAWMKSKQAGKKLQTFNFLGFTHYCGVSRKGKFAVKVKTMSKRLRRSLKRMAQWCKSHMHDPIRIQWQQINLKLRGHYEYYGRTTNSDSLAKMRHQTVRIWHHSLNRRTRGDVLRWKSFARILINYPLLPAHIPRTRRPTQLWLQGDLA